MVPALGASQVQTRPESPHPIDADDSRASDWCIPDDMEGISDYNIACAELDFGH